MDKIKHLIHYFLDLDTLPYKIISIVLFIMFIRFSLNKDWDYVLLPLGLSIVFFDLGW